MQVIIDDKTYEVNIKRKYIKNMYLRFKDGTINITANPFVSQNTIYSFIENNKKTILKMAKHNEKKEEKKDNFYYLGNKYDVVITNAVTKIEFHEDKVFVKNRNYLDTFLKNECERLFNERVKICYNMFEEDIPYPTVIVWKMKRKWGYCNKTKKLVKLNFDLIKYSLNEIDYVIIHELCHFLEFNHSKSFWKYVKKYNPNYKEAQKVLKEE